MSSVVLTGDTSGSGTITVPAVAGTFTATIGSATGTHYPFTAGTAVTCAGQTSIDFTSIPSWVKRITVMFSGVSTSGTSNILIQLGDAGGIENTGYASWSQSGTTAASSTAGFIQNYANVAAASTHNGNFTLCLQSGTTWVGTGIFIPSSGQVSSNGGPKALSDVLTQVRITTVNGTDTFDTTPSAGSINILYE